MAEQIAKGHSWKRENIADVIQERGTDAMKKLWADKTNEIMSVANRTGTDPLLLLSQIAADPTAAGMSQTDFIKYADNFTAAMDASGGDIRTAVSMGLNGPEATQQALKDTGALPQDTATLQKQDEVLSGYMGTKNEVPASTSPKLAKGSAVATDASGRSLGESDGTYLRPNDPIADQSYALDSGGANPLFSGLVQTPSSDERRMLNERDAGIPPTKRSAYSEPGYEDALDFSHYDIDIDGDNSGLEDLGNAFMVGLSSTFTDSAVMAGAIGENFFGVGEGLRDWGLSASASVERRYHVDNPTWWTALSGGMGSMVIPMISGGLGARMMTTGPARMLAMKWAQKQASSGMLTKVGGALAGRASRVGFAAGAAAPEAFAQAGNTYRSLVNSGATHDEAFTGASQDGMANVGILGVSDYFMSVGFGSGYKVLRNALIRGASEGVQELAQGRSQAWQMSKYTDQPFNLLDQSMVTEGSVGFVLGMFVGTGAMAASEFGGNIKAQQESFRDKANAANYIEEASLGLRKGTITSTTQEILDHLVGADFKPQSPQETEALIEAQIYIERMVNLSDKSKTTKEGIPELVAEELQKVLNVLSDPKVLESENIDEAGKRALTLWAHTLENYTLVHRIAHRIKQNHTLEEQEAAVTNALNILDRNKKDSDALSPNMMMMTTAMIKNLTDAGKLNGALRDRILNAKSSWGHAANIAEGKSVARYAVQVLERRNNKTGENEGWDVVYRSTSGQMEGEIHFEGEGAEELARAEYKRLAIKGYNSTDFGFKSQAEMRIEEDELKRSEGEAQQATVERLQKKIDSITKEIDSLQKDAMDPALPNGRRQEAEARAVNLNADRMTYSGRLNEHLKTFTPMEPEVEEAASVTEELPTPVESVPTTEPDIAETAPVQEQPAPEPVEQVEEEQTEESPEQAPTVKAEDLGPLNPKTLKEWVDANWEASEGPTKQLSDDSGWIQGLAGKLGVKVSYAKTKVKGDRLWAYYDYDTRTIVLRDDLDAEGQMEYVTAHELGHNLYNEQRELSSLILAEMNDSDLDIENYLDQSSKTYAHTAMTEEYFADRLAAALISGRGREMIDDFINSASTAESKKSRLTLVGKLYEFVGKWLPKVKSLLDGSPLDDRGALMKRFSDLERRVRRSAETRRYDEGLDDGAGKIGKLRSNARYDNYVRYDKALRDRKIQSRSVRAAKKLVGKGGRLYVAIKDVMPGANPIELAAAKKRLAEKPSLIKKAQPKVIEAPSVGQEDRSAEIIDRKILNQRVADNTGLVKKSREIVEKDTVSEDMRAIEQAKERLANRPPKPIKLSPEEQMQVEAVVERISIVNQAEQMASQEALEETSVDNLFTDEMNDSLLLSLEEMIEAGEISAQEAEAVERLTDSAMLGGRLPISTETMLMEVSVLPVETRLEKAIDIEMGKRDSGPLSVGAEESLLGIGRDATIAPDAAEMEAMMREEFALEGDSLSLGEARYIMSKAGVPRNAQAALNVFSEGGFQQVGISQLSELIRKSRPQKSDSGLRGFMAPLGRRKKYDVDEMNDPDTAAIVESTRKGTAREGQSFKEWLDLGTTRFYTQFVDRNHSMKMIVDALTDTSIDDQLDAGTSIYHNLKGLLTGWGSSADLAINKGFHSFKDETKYKILSGHEASRGKTVKGIGEILDEHKIDISGKGWDEFNAYLQARRITTIAKEKPGQVTPELLARSEGSLTALRKSYPHYEAAAMDLNVAARGIIMYLEEMGNISEGSRKALLATEFYMPLYSAAVETSGKIGGSQGAIKGVNKLGTIETSEMLPALDQLQTQMAQATSAGVSNYVKAQLAELLSQQINPELGMVLDLETGREAHNKGTIVASVSGNDALLRTMESEIDKLAKEHGLDDLTKEQLMQVMRGETESTLNHQIWLSRIDYGSDMLGFFDRGEFKVMRVHEDVASRFTQERLETSKKLINFASKSTRLLRTGATLDPGFWARNFVRDVPSAMIGALGMINNPKDAVKFTNTLFGTPKEFLDSIKEGGLRGVRVGGAMGDVLRGDIDPGYLLHGGGLSTLSGQDSSADMDERRASVQKMQRKGAIQSVAFAARHPLQLLEMLSGNAETMTRIAVYRRRREQLTSEKPDVPMHIISQLAALDSRDATLDFARAGEIGRVINQLSPFWNAMVQGVDKMGRSFVNDPTGTMLRGMISITLPSMALYALNHDKEWYKKRPAWEKNMFWMFSLDGENIQRIPKPFDWGMLFGSLPERMADQFAGSDPDAFGDWVGMFSQMLTTVDVNKLAKGDLGASVSSAVPTPFISSLVALATGYDSFTQSSIVPPGLKDVTKAAKYTHNTSWASRRLIDFLENDLGMPVIMSPIQIDHFVRSNTGGLGTSTLMGASKLLRMVDPKAPKNDFHTKDFRDRALLISAFNSDEHSANTQYSTKFHEALRMTAQAQTTIGLFKRTYNAQELERYQHLRPMAEVADQMRAFGELAKGFTNTLKIIESDQSMDPQEKRRKYRKIIDNRDLIYKRGLEVYRVMQKAAEAESKRIKKANKLKGRA